MFSKFKIFTAVWILLTCALYGESLSYNEILKACQEEQVVAAHEVFDSLCQSDFEKNNLVFTQVQGGMTRARLYSFIFNDQKYVLRFLDPKHPENQRHNEIQACKIAYSLRIGPNCIASDKDALLMIMPFIEGHTLAFKNLSDANLICHLGEMIHSLHTYPASYPTRYTLLERLRIHYQKGKNSGIAYPTGFDQSVANVLSKSSNLPSVPCHGDLNPSNILINNDEIFIIDWANATWDDPFVDLSYISLLTNMTDEQERVFLKAYFGREAKPHELERLKENQSKIYLITAAIWLRYSENLEDQQLSYHERVAKLDAKLNDPTLKSAQDYLREGKVVDLRSGSKEAITAYALSFYKAFLSTSKV